MICIFQQHYHEQYTKFTNYGLPEESPANSVLPEWVGLLGQSVLVEYPDLHTVPRVDVPFGRSQKGLIDNLNSLLLGLGLFLILPGVVVAHELRIQVGDDHMSTAALRQGPIGPVTADGIIPIDDPPALLIQPRHQIERVVREEPAAIQCFREEVGDGLGGRQPVHPVLVGQQLDFEDALQLLVVGVHPRGRQDRLVGELGQFAHAPVHDIELVRQTGVACHDHVVWPRDGHHSSCVEDVRFESRATVLDLVWVGRSGTFRIRVFGTVWREVRGEAVWLVQTDFHLKIFQIDTDAYYYVNVQTTIQRLLGLALWIKRRLPFA